MKYLLLIILSIIIFTVALFIGTVIRSQKSDIDGGIGLSYSTGKLGVEISPGIILDHDGYLGVGFGF